MEPAARSSQNEGIDARLTTTSCGGREGGREGGGCGIHILPLIDRESESDWYMQRTYIVQ